MRRFLPYIIAASILMLGSLAGIAAPGKKLHLPRHCPVKPQSDSVNGTVFSSPDAQSDVIPSFVGKGGKPINADAQPRLPGFDHAKLLSDLSADQRKQIESLQSHTGMAVQAWQDHINVLNQKLDLVKAHPKQLVTVQGDTLPDADQIKAEIAGLRKNIQQKRQDASAELSKILTDKQCQTIDKMRHGELLQDMVLDRKEAQ